MVGIGTHTHDAHGAQASRSQLSMRQSLPQEDSQAGSSLGSIVPRALKPGLRFDGLLSEGAVVKAMRVQGTPFLISESFEAVWDSIPVGGINEAG
eukprot:5946098-Alexandrium_andersonii.AAC.1